MQLAARSSFGIPCGTRGNAGGNAELARRATMMGAGCCMGKQGGGSPCSPFLSAEHLWGVLLPWPLARGFIMGFCCSNKAELGTSLWMPSRGWLS